MVRQGASDAKAEAAKALMPGGCPLEPVVGALDVLRKGYVVDTDLWRLVQDFGGTASFGSVSALVHEVQLRRRYDQVVLPGRLSLREVGALVFPVGSREYEAVGSATSDAEAKSMLYLLRYSEPCPGCGVRVQRDADAAGCPSVVCPICGTPFRCFCIMGDACAGDPQDPTGEAPLSPSTRYRLYRLVSAAARAAHDIEFDRKILSLMQGFDVRALSDIFGHIAGGQLSFAATDLRRVLAEQCVSFSEEELGHVWRRYAPQGGATVAFPDFVRQLKLRAAAPPW